MPVSAAGKPQNLVRGHGGDLIIIELEPHIATGANPSRYLSKTYALNIKTFSYGNLIIILCHKPMRIEDLEMRAHP